LIDSLFSVDGFIDYSFLNEAPKDAEHDKLWTSASDFIRFGQNWQLSAAAQNALRQTGISGDAPPDGSKLDRMMSRILSAESANLSLSL
jgi:hypothetical protein